MITAGRLRSCHGAAEVMELFRELGYPVEPVEVDRDEWRRGGVPVPWNGTTRFHLMARLPGVDVFLLDGSVPSESIARFLLAYADYNILTKSVIVNTTAQTCSIFDVSRTGQLRRLSFDCTAPSTLAVDRMNLLEIGGSDPHAAMRIFDRALDRQSIGRQFFVRFRAAVRDVAEELRGFHPEETKEEVASQALLILSRLLFLSFVQEKGWLNGERRFLIDRYDSARVAGVGPAGGKT